jgi:ABC-type branched-subunit amino acid transport system ATPase component
MALLEIRGLTKDFGGVRAISELDLAVEESEIVSVIGPNGAGKTTLFNLITGMLPVDHGEVVFDGQDVAGLPPSQILERGIARTFQNVRLFPEMTVLENVMVARHCRTRSGMFKAILKLPSFRREEEETRRRAEEALAFFGSRLVGYRTSQPAYSLSYANRRRLEIARAMASGPKLILLDEPTAGMNPRETKELASLISEIRDRAGVTILLIEHDMPTVKGASERVVVLDHGTKIAEGSYDEVATNEQVIEAYLGRRTRADGGAAPADLGGTGVAEAEPGTEDEAVEAP